MLPKKDLCSGCGACAAACPKNCIEMKSDGEGFRYPEIDRARCVSCGKCESVCPVIAPLPVSQHTAALAAQNQEAEIRRQSSSGGVFSALADWALAKGGLVCAAVYGEDHSVVHTFAETSAEIGAMRGAKYAQSRAEQCFPEIQAALKQGRRVLFVGTPCQTAALRRYLGKDYGELLLVDMVCHGVPSPKVWQRYLTERLAADAPEGRFAHINLRSKKTGWSRYAYSVDVRYENGAEYQLPQGQDWFMRGFVANLYLRPSCAQCGFKGVERCSDLTLGDCWGIWDIAPEFDDDKGTSLLLIHSEKGQRVWAEIAPRFAVYPLTEAQAVEKNPSAVCSSVPHPNRERFFEKLPGKKPVSVLIRQCIEPKKGLLEKVRAMWRENG